MRLQIYAQNTSNRVAQACLAVPPPALDTLHWGFVYTRVRVSTQLFEHEQRTSRPGTGWVFCTRTPRCQEMSRDESLTRTTSRSRGASGRQQQRVSVMSGRPTQSVALFACLLEACTRRQAGFSLSVFHSAESRHAADVMSARKSAPRAGPRAAASARPPRRARAEPITGRSRA